MTINRKVKVVQEDKAPVAVEVIASAIISISQGVKALRASRLNDRALLLLIQHAAPMVGNKPLSQKEVRAVLDGIESLEATYIRKRT